MKPLLMGSFDTTDIDTNLVSCLGFILEISKLKSVLRKTYLKNQDRYENSAEHSWHMILMAITLQPYANTPIDLDKVIKMLAVHDLGEIDGGDTYLYAENRGDNDHEKQCMKRICAIAPKDQAKTIMDLWIEFESSQTPEAKFAQAIDRFQPFLYTLQNGGDSWLSNNIPYELVMAKNAHIEDGSEILWDAYKKLITQAKDKGFFPDHLPDTQPNTTEGDIKEDNDAA